jgi:hypothetical protein
MKFVIGTLGTAAERIAVEQGIATEVPLSEMAYQFTEYEDELVPDASAALSGGPPKKLTGIGVLDPPASPRHPMRQSPPSPAAPVSLWLRMVAVIFLAGFAVLTVLSVVDALTSLRPR